MIPTLEIAKDLTKEPPRSPRLRLGGYAILARTTDKCRAFLTGKIGEYHFDCPLDNFLFGFKAVTGNDFKAVVEKGASDSEVLAWLNANGAPKTDEEIKKWSDGVEANKPYEDPERRDWFAEQTKPLGLDPATTSLFDWLEADDKASYAK
ncbi:MAG: DUF5069 domain-containing protein [Chthoniobacteraceae bacterium]|jgi:hypothetical protein